MPKIVTVPPDIIFQDIADGRSTGDSIGFRSFVLHTLLSNPIWSKDLDAARMAGDVLSCMNEMTDGKVKLPSSIHDKLCACVKDTTSWVLLIKSATGQTQQAKPTGVYMMQMISFADAILKADES